MSTPNPLLLLRQGRRLNMRLLKWALLLLAAAALPYVVVSPGSRLLAATALIYALLAGSWNLTLGFGGIFNFAHVGFFGVGGYAMAIATMRWEWSSLAGLTLAVLAGAIAGALTYLPVIRMRGIYVALITFVFVQLCYYLVLAVPDLTGGSSGLPGLPAFTVGDHNFSLYGGLGYLWTLAAAVALMLILLDILLSRPFGHSLIALRDNEALATSRGIHRVRQHLLAFALSGALAGFTGAMYVSYFRVADGGLFSFSFVTLGLSMIFLGGTRYTWGPVVGAVLITVLVDQMSDYGAWRQIVIALGTIFILIVAPQGVAGLLASWWQQLKGTRISPAQPGVPAARPSKRKALQ